MDIRAFMNVARHICGNRVTIMLRGRHGIGKSEILKQFAREQMNFTDKDIVDRRMSQLSEGDVIGLPKLEDGVTRFYPAEFIMRAADQPTFLFLDEINRASPEVMQATFQLVLDRELNGVKLHPDTIIVTAVNNSAEYQVNEMDPALLDRFWVIDLEPSVQDWLDWARGAGKIHQNVVSYITQNERMLESVKATDAGKVVPSRRSWKRLNDALVASGVIDEPEDPRFYSLCVGFVGIEVANHFNSFVRTLERQVKIEDILNDFEKNVSRLAKVSMDQVNDINTKIIDHIKAHLLTREHARNIGGWLSMLPGEHVINVWTQFLANAKTEHGTPNIVMMHPFMVHDILVAAGAEAKVENSNDAWKGLPKINASANAAPAEKSEPTATETPKKRGRPKKV